MIKIVGNNFGKILIAITIIFSIVSFFFLVKHGLVMVYGDSKGHINIARRVYDTPTPGIAQLGAYWLPLLHILMLPTVWNDTFWQTGLAGSIPNMILFVLLVFFTYKFSYELSEDKIIAGLSSLVVLLNPNMLVLQGTPMTEAVFVSTMLIGSYLFYMWANNRKKIVYLIESAVFLCLCSLTRYEGWASVASGTGILGIAWIFSKFRKKNEGHLILFSSIAWLGIFLWILWGAVILHSPLDFIHNDQSARNQLDQSLYKATGQGHLPLAILTNLYSIVHTSGMISGFILIIGITFYLYKKRLNIFSLNNFSLVLLLSPLIFDILAVYFGNVPVEVPELSKTPAPGNFFNIRYSLFSLPAIAISLTILSYKKKIVSLLLFLLIIGNYCYMVYPNWENLAVFQDSGASGKLHEDSEKIAWFKKNYKNGYVLISTGAGDGFMFDTGIPLKSYIVEGTYHFWAESMQQPEKYSSWVILDSGNKRDAVSKYVNKANLSKYFNVVYQSNTYKMYQRKNNLEVLRPTSGSFNLIGFNSYDLVYLKEKDIDATIKAASEAGVSAIRLWGFGEGRPDGFQPSFETFNEKAFDNLAYTLAVLDAYHIKAIVTLANYWKDYGGAPQYLAWDGLPNKTPADWDVFFTHDYPKNRYRSFVGKLLRYQSKYTGKALKDDPAILAWELMNEPRSSTKQNGKIITSWLQEMSAYVKGIDQTHSVFPGTEGFSDLYNAGENGPSITEVAAIPNIDAVTGHFYSEYNTKKIALPTILTDWSKTAQQARKPFILEEIGFDKRKDKNNSIDRAESVKDLLSSMSQLQMNGLLLWNFALKSDDNYGISPVDPKDTLLLDNIRSAVSVLPAEK